ncbi:hypothetical protein FQR65_LT12746 [Abscondita terminalis]|nr:hypothetical protein FQR65_LT12746 [Abscondita terminalis]
MSAINYNNGPLGQDMVMCPYNEFHIMLRHRLPKHLYKCHPEETFAKMEAENKKKMEEWERQQKQLPPIQQKIGQNASHLEPNEYWDDEEPNQTYVPPHLHDVIINRKGFIYGKK